MLVVWLTGWSVGWSVDLISEFFIFFSVVDGDQWWLPCFPDRFVLKLFYSFFLSLTLILFLFCFSIENIWEHMKWKLYILHLLLLVHLTLHSMMIGMFQNNNHWFDDFEKRKMMMMMMNKEIHFHSNQVKKKWKLNIHEKIYLN